MTERTGEIKIDIGKKAQKIVVGARERERGERMRDFDKTSFQRKKGKKKQGDEGRRK